MKKWLIIILIGILIGIIFGLGTVFGFFQLLILFGISTLIIIILFAVWKKPSRNLNYAIGIYASICFGLIFCFIFAKIKKEYNQRNADLITDKIIVFKNDFDRYPNSLNELKKEQELPKYFDQFELKDFEYSLNKSKKEFYLTYSLDGWHINEYDSETKDWQVRD